MRERKSRALWIVAALAAALTVAAVVVDPRDFVRPDEPDELSSTVEKAATYFEFEHYDRAAETYAVAAEEGMQDGIEWFRYAKSAELSEGIDLGLYVTTYQLLLEQVPYHEYLEETERILSEHAEKFSYEEAKNGDHPDGTLMVVEGSVYRVRRGRIESGTDVLFVNTKPDKWFGYMGDPVRVVAPRNAGYQSGDTVTAIGWYDGWCDVSDDAGLSSRYPCVIAAGVVTE